MSRTVSLKIRPDLPYHTKRRARLGIGSMSAVHEPRPSVEHLMDMLGGVRSACHAAGLGLDTLYRMRDGGGTLNSYRKLAAAAGLRVKIVDGKSERWEVLHSSRDMCWRTPPEVWRSVLGRLGIEQFDLDPCAPEPDDPCAWSIPCRERFTAKDDGLSKSWGEPGSVVFVNPPYGQALRHWIDKAISEAARGVVVFALVPARTGTNWWHKANESGGKAELLRGRLRFIGPDGRPGNPAPFDSALISWTGA